MKTESDKLRNLLHRFLEKGTPEQEQERRQQRIAKIKTISLDYQLGRYVGEEIARDHLPTLSTDWLRTCKVIQVTQEETERVDELEKNWGKSHKAATSTNIEWEELRAFREILEAKYLPDELVCHIQPVNVKDDGEFKKGVADAIWDSDLSHYSCSGPEDIEFHLSDDAFFSVITLKRTK